MGLFDKIRARMGKTRENLSDKVDALVEVAEELDDDFFDELEDILILADRFQRGLCRFSAADDRRGDIARCQPDEHEDDKGRDEEDGDHDQDALNDVF